MEEVIDYLQQIEKYSQLLRNWRDRQTIDIRFELLFAYWCENRNVSLSYEVNVNPENQQTVDFSFEANTGIRINFELVRPDLNQGIRSSLSGNVFQGYSLTSDHQNEDFRTCAQLIKLQYGLLQKVNKFPNVSESDANIIVVDCSNVHSGMFDHHDLGMTLYGYPSNPMWQEFWGDQKLLGILEDGYSQRGSVEFHEKVSGVIFIPRLRMDILNGAFMGINKTLNIDFQRQVLGCLQPYSAFKQIQLVT